MELLPIDASFGVELPLQLANDGFERPIFRPSAEAVIDGLPVAIAQIVTDLRQVAPRGAGAQNPEDAVEHLPVVLVRAAAYGQPRPSTSGSTGSMRSNCSSVSS